MKILKNKIVPQKIVLNSRMYFSQKDSNTLR